MDAVHRHHVHPVVFCPVMMSSSIGGGTWSHATTRNASHGRLIARRQAILGKHERTPTDEQSCRQDQAFQGGHYFLQLVTPHSPSLWAKKDCKRSRTNIGVADTLV